MGGFVASPIPVIDRLYEFEWDHFLSVPQFPHLVVALFKTLQFRKSRTLTSTTEWL